jgi:hypothetical protein
VTDRRRAERCLVTRDLEVLRDADGGLGPRSAVIDEVHGDPRHRHQRGREVDEIVERRLRRRVEYGVLGQGVEPVSF